MKPLLTTVLVLSIAILASCDFRSGIAKREMEKLSGTPTPSISPLPTPEPIDPADIVQVDTTLEGSTLTVNGASQNKTLSCSKFDRVMINGSGSVVTINGACRQIMINGNSNQIKADAAMEFVFNGTGNSLRYSRFANGKRPTVTENRSGNVIEKTSFEAEQSRRSQGKGK